LITSNLVLFGDAFANQAHPSLWLRKASGRAPGPTKAPKRPCVYLLGFPFVLSAVFKVPVRRPPGCPGVETPVCTGEVRLRGLHGRLSGATVHRWNGRLLKDENP